MKKTVIIALTTAGMLMPGLAFAQDYLQAFEGRPAPSAYAAPSQYNVPDNVPGQYNAPSQYSQGTVVQGIANDVPTYGAPYSAQSSSAGYQSSSQIEALQPYTPPAQAYAPQAAYNAPMQSYFESSPARSSMASTRGQGYSESAPTERRTMFRYAGSPKRYDVNGRLVRN